jgi:hypothetical protein
MIYNVKWDAKLIIWVPAFYWAHFIADDPTDTFVWLSGQLFWTHKLTSLWQRKQANLIGHMGNVQSDPLRMRFDGSEKRRIWMLFRVSAEIITVWGQKKLAWRDPSEAGLEGPKPIRLKGPQCTRPISPMRTLYSGRQLDIEARDCNYFKPPDSLLRTQNQYLYAIRT